MKTTIKFVLFLAGILLMSSGCGGSEERGSNPSPSPTPATPPPTAGSADRSAQDLKLGDTARFDSSTVTVYDYVGPFEDEAWTPATGKRYVAIDVGVCAGDGPTDFNPFAFDLVLPDDTRRMPGAPAARPPLGATTFAAGDCGRGFVSFEEPPEDPTHVAFSGPPGNPPAKWAIR
jgi:hypothetical protein